MAYVRQAEVVRHVSRPSQDRWVPTLKRSRSSWRMPRQSGQFSSVWVEVRDDPYDNGVMAKRLIFTLVERTDVVVPDTYYPTPPRRFRVPTPDHERLYPPERD